jgi:regulator of protease activity HflC (stomatin/prohibitin superfamily)
MDNQASLMILTLVIVIAFIVLGVLLGSFFTIYMAERGVVERFNMFSRIAGPGLTLQMPFAEAVHRVDMRVCACRNYLYLIVRYDRSITI